MFAKPEEKCFNAFLNLKHTHTCLYCLSKIHIQYSILHVAQEQKYKAVVHISVVLVKREGDECKHMIDQLRGYLLQYVHSNAFMKHLLLLRLFPIEVHTVICLIWFKSNSF